jgi:phosphatidylserine/phosphatidylglycerophosphate/cardiolipin synthase-like enzyme
MRPGTIVLLLAALVYLPHADASAQRAGHPDFELVESVPVETTLDNPDVRDAHEVWLEMIDGAQTSLDIEQFYISNQAGEPLEDIIAAIERAAQRGVTVRIISESKFYKTYPETIDRLNKQSHVFTRLIDFGKLAGGIQHAKFFIVDGRSIYLGSQNFDWRSLKHIHELGIRIAHAAAVRMYHDIFELDWTLSAINDRSAIASVLTHTSYKAPYRSIRGKDTIIFTPTASPAGLLPDSTLWDEPNMVKVIDAAHHELSAQFLGYDTRERGGSAYTVLDNALRRAAARGVQVRLLVADWEKGMGGEQALKALAAVPNISVKFSVMPEWSGGYVSFARVEHCKYILADSSAFWLGTGNAEKNYFYGCRNLGVVVQNGPLATLLHRIFLASWQYPTAEFVEAGKSYEPRRHGEN